MSSPPNNDHPGAVPPHLVKRRKQTYRLRRRKYALGVLPAGEPDEPVKEAPAAPQKTQLEEIRHELEHLKQLATSAQQQLISRNATIKTLRVQLDEKDDLIKKKDQAFDEARRVVEQARTRIQRTHQEMEQLRRRTEKDKEDVRRYASEKLLRRLFPILDNFTVAVEALEQGGDPAELARGIVMIHREMMNVLKEKGFVEIEALGKPFDPQLHEAVSTTHDPSLPNHTVSKLMRHGYTLGDKVLRPAMVEVNKLPEGSEPASESPQSSSSEANAPREEDQQASLAAASEELGKSESKITPLERAQRMLDRNKTEFPD